ncbi:hypothetical protein CO180_02930 [candidate division WWE3 bacterium CG_4_9_14_3_um_filter_41_6]|uniref:Uncharacterized protein n=1 Tax=candidate division WWE3 bacterium CG_4_10_14_0_2_um_filter_41_14 TaxID=1975072 RepID=A0A2M7TLG5_UNCKA|nr:MAG: hypothetical protein COY32_00755 [candidate division WWE3 bacterium CG_4_10_14_0_2_um_filter_41_14]PJA38661.1 MAG: hypothetical protein CO180_02930 [candidate division WWE3 bacterium CG_4_9_14_3_um_filter_41_6]
MEPYELNEKQEVAKFELKNKRKSLVESNVQNSNISELSRSIFSDLYDKTLVYSAGAFSFSLALIGLVLQDNKAGLTFVGFFLPNIYWLYISLFAYLLTMFLVLISKKFDAIYLGYFGMGHYAGKLAEFEKANIGFIKVHEGALLMTGGTEDSAVETSNHNSDVASRAAKKNTKKSDLYYSLMRGCEISAEMCAFFASILLFIFFWQLTQSVVWN